MKVTFENLSPEAGLRVIALAEGVDRRRVVAEAICASRHAPLFLKRECPCPPCGQLAQVAIEAYESASEHKETP